MGMFSWLYRKSLVGAISSNLIKQYLSIKSHHPNDEDVAILERVWNLWLTLNEEAIHKEDDLDKNVRLSIVNDDHKKNSSRRSLGDFKSLFDLFQAILYIETEILSTDGKIYDNCATVFLKESIKYDLDFYSEYNLYKRTLKLIGK